jgi:hypothetical protein
VDDIESPDVIVVSGTTCEDVCCEWNGDLPSRKICYQARRIEITRLYDFVLFRFVKTRKLKK